jgi:xanthine dehydrogenase YagR molybdenum-binding subunit
MGKPEPRIDGRLKVTGEARYGSDFSVANPAYGFLVTSTIAKGRIGTMELSEAKGVPGVLEIFYHANINELKNSSELKVIEYRSGGGGPTSAIQDFGPEIKYGGQIIALVVAETFEAAREAAHKIHVRPIRRSSRARPSTPLASARRISASRKMSRRQAPGGIGPY